MRRVFTVALLSILALGIIATAGFAQGKFREIPLSWILDLEERLATPWTPAGPNGEKILAAADLKLSAAEKNTIRNMKLGEYFFMGATLDETEILNKVGMDAVLAEVGKSPMPFMGAGSISEQIDQINGLAARAKDVSFIVAEAYEGVTTGPVFTALAKAGVPQLHNWTTPRGLYGTPNYIGLIDADGYGQGAAAAEILAYAMNYKGEVGLIYFALEQWTNVMRLKGAEDTFAKYPNIKVVAKEGFTDPAQGYDIAVGMLQSHPEIDAIWATWMSGPCTGAAEAIRALGLVGEVVAAAPDLGGIAGARFIADKNYPIIGCGAADCIEMGKNSVNAALKFLLGTKLLNAYAVSRVYPIVRANLMDGFYKATMAAMGVLPKDVLLLLED
jgi:ribose transport system substrate-binding protein